MIQLAHKMHRNFNWITLGIKNKISMNTVKNTHSMFVDVEKSIQ